ncbi:phosphoribosylglycinamide formyltransferase [Rhizobiales bacterium]|uniref:phosphoribosylglycinamide formyltransferase n=1 Tax=Hongsoonwoonella zoysiae TaxID=2821844 RepID=UPI001560F98F|nr:phosphoribosylglycinamide formyltransferase [Hongsoonwoonella zoysiae]NRG18919.1 phosphoribosylglycinamide formyltransferase [Hongsoonwoonella zoysiae]
MTLRKRVAVLISGRGSNMTALIEAARANDYPAEIALVVSNVPEAGGLEKASAEGIETATIDHRGRGSRQAFEEELDRAIRDRNIDLICLAGFMRILTPWFTDRWHDRILNIHPALLPSFKGLDTHTRALAEGCRIHGATVHFVRSEMDAGPIIVQGAVPVMDGDDAATLAARVLAVEHKIYPRALALVASERTSVEGMRVLTGVEGSNDFRSLIVPEN